MIQTQVSAEENRVGMAEPATRELGGTIVSVFQATKERIVFKVEVLMF